MRIISIGDLVLDYYYNNGKLVGVNGGMSSQGVFDINRRKILECLYKNHDYGTHTEVSRLGRIKR